MTIGSALIIIAIIAAGCFVLWLLFVSVAAIIAMRKPKEFKKDFDKGFDSDFFRNARRPRP